MALTHDLSARDRQLVDYLLGLLPEEEAELLDEESIVDDDVAARLCGVEEDLVDAYVTGTLDAKNRSHFETYYLKSPLRRGKVKFARRFLAVVDRASAAATPAPAMAGAGADRVRRFSPRPETIASKPATRRARFSWPMLTAAASMLITCGVFVKDMQVRHGLDQVRAQSAAQSRRAAILSKQLDEARNENAQIAEQLNRARAESLPPEQLSALALPAVRPGATASRAVVLFPQTRSVGQPTTIRIQPNAEIRFDLRLESNEFARYRAILRTASDNSIVWRSAVLVARTAPSSSVPLAVPSHVLNAQHYSIELSGIDAAGLETTVSSYGFQTDRRVGVR